MTTPQETSPAETEELLRAVLDNAMDGIGIMAMDGTLLYTSLSIESILGYTQEEAMKMNMFTLLHPMEYLRAMGALKRAFENPGMVLREEFRGKHKDGSWRQLEFVGKSGLIHFLDKRAVFLNYRDVTDQKKARQAAERLSLIVESSNDAIFTLSREGAVLSWNPSAQEIYGYAAEEIGGRHFSLLMSPPEAEAFLETLGEILSGGIRGAFHAIHQTKKGLPLPVSLTLSPVRESNGEINRVSVIARDISEIQKSIETAKHLASLLENTPDAILSCDLSGKITLWNRGAEAMFGYKADEIIGLGAGVLQLDGKSDEQINLREKIISGEVPLLHYETQRRRKDGSKVEVEFRFFPVRDADGKITGLTGIGRDITYQKKVQQAAEDLARIVESSNDAIFTLSKEGMVLSWNASAGETYGYSAAEIIGHPFYHLMDPAEMPAFREALSAVFKGESLKPFEGVHLTQLGSPLPVSITLSPIQDPGGEIRLVSVIARDISDHHKSIETAKHLSSLLENTPDAIVSNGLDGTITLWNRGAEAMFGYKAEEVIGKVVNILQPDEKSNEQANQRKRLISGETSLLQYETKRRRKDGTLFDVEFRLFPVKNAEGKITGVTAIGRDITQKLHAEKILAESEARFRRIFDKSPFGMSLATPGGVLKLVNPKFRQILGYAPGELTDKSFAKITHPEDVSKDLDAMRRMVRGEFNSYETEKRYLHKDGRAVWVHLVVAALGEVKSDDTLFLAMVEDITEKKKAGEISQRLSVILENTPYGITSSDSKGVITAWNKASETMYGYSEGEILGRSAALLAAPGKEREQAGLWEKVARGEAVTGFETLRRRKNGDIFDVVITLSPVKDSQGQVTGMAVITQDVTDKKLTEKVLRESEARFRGVFEKSPLGMILGTTDGTLKIVNPKFLQILGFEESEVIDRSIDDFTHPEDIARDQDAFRRMMEGQSEFYETEKRYRHKDGHWVWGHLVLATFKEENSRDSLLLGMLEDTTHQKQAKEISLRLSEILEHTPDAIVSGDLNGVINGWNQGAEKMFGYAAQEALGQSIDMLVPSGESDEHTEIRRRMLNGETIVGYEMTRQRKNGEVFDASITFSPIRDSQGQLAGVTSITRDMSEKKRAEKTLREQAEHLMQAQKMDAIGRLAGGVAHDFNNLLSIIGANAGFVLGGLVTETHREELEEIDKAVKKGAELTKQLLLLGQKQVTQAQPVQLNDLGWESSRMLKRLFDASIDLVLDLDPDLKPIYADTAQIQQVILNLALNARDAMPKGGRLTIQTRNETSQGEGFFPEFGPWVKLSVSDTGTGIDPEVQKHIFEPFFTTKKDKGTGLGLTTVYGIVQQWKGQIQLQSAPGKGTVFSLYFPVYAGSEKKEPRPQQVSLIPDGTETVLVAEDDSSVRKAVVRTLKKHGYQVLEAENGVDAIQEKWNFKGKIHLLLTDTVMPKLNGLHLAEEMVRADPKIKVIFMSGYTKEILTQKGEIDPGIRLLKKPFPMEEMVREVRRTLDEK